MTKRSCCQLKEGLVFLRHLKGTPHERVEIRCSSISRPSGSIFTVWHKFNYDAVTRPKQNVLEQCHGVSDVFWKPKMLRISVASISRKNQTLFRTTYTGEICQELKEAIRGCLTDIYITIYNSNEITVIKQQRNNFMIRVTTT